MSPHALSPVLRPEDVAFIRRGVSVCVASRDVRHVPSLARGLGCVVEEGGLRLRLLMVRTQCEVLLRDVEQSGQVAVVFVRPSTSQALQVKGSDGRLAPASDHDRQALQDCFHAFVEDLSLIGFSEDFTRRYYGHAPDDLVVVVFTPDAAFVQTPGPNAGAPLTAAAAAP